MILKSGGGGPQFGQPQFVVDWEAAGIDPEQGAIIEQEFKDTMNYPITQGPSPDPALNAGVNTAAWLNASTQPDWENTAFTDEEGNPIVPGGGASGWGGEGGEGGFGPFNSYQDWVDQFTEEHGRPPTSEDEADALDSFDFLSNYGRAPTQEEWENRWWTGDWFGGGGGYGGGGWGGWGGGGSYGQSDYGGGYGYQRPTPWWWTTMQRGI